MRELGDVWSVIQNVSPYVMGCNRMNVSILFGRIRVRMKLPVLLRPNESI